MKARQDYLPREKLDKYLNTNPSSSLSSLVPRGMTEDELTAEFTRKFESVGVSVIFRLRYVRIEKEKTGTIQRNLHQRDPMFGGCPVLR